MRTAAGATAVGAVGLGTQTQRAEAIGPAILLAYPAATTIGTLAAATVVGQKFYGASSEVTPEEVNETAVQQSTWEIATGVTKSRDTFIEELRHEYGIGEAVDTLSTSHGAAMWSAVETSIARSRIDGDTEAAAETDARAALNKYAAQSTWNNLDRWNSFWEALINAVAKSITGEGVITPAGGSFTALEDSSQTAIDTAEADPIVEANGKTYVWADYLSGPNVDLPNWLDLTVVAGDDDSIEASDLYVTRYVVDGSVVDVLDPATTGQIEAVHPDYGTQTLADSGLYATLVDKTRALRNDLSANMATTVGSIYEQFEIGQKSPSDVISSQEMLQEFDGGDTLSEQEAVAGLVARGYAMPSDLETPVTVNHPDLEGETTGWLFVDTSKELTLTGGTTLPASEYDMAYIVFESAVDGTTQTEMLSGTGDLEIVSYEGAERTQLEFTTGDAVVDPHYLYLLEDHQSLQDGTAGRIEVTGQDVDYSIAPSQLESPGTDAPSDAVYQYEHADASSYGPDTVEVVSGLTIRSRETSYVSDPTAPQATNERVDRMLAAWEDIRAQLEGLEGGGGGGGGGGDIGLGAIAALVGGGGVLAYVLGGS